MFKWYISKRVREENADLLKAVQNSGITGDLIDKLIAYLVYCDATRGLESLGGLLNRRVAEIKQLIAEIRNHEDYKPIWSACDKWNQERKSQRAWERLKTFWPEKPVRNRSTQSYHSPLGRERFGLTVLMR